jgi:glycine/serine hydroxymethyltransferase
LIYERSREDADGEKIGDSIPFIKPALIICGDSLNRKSSEYQRLVEIATKKYCCVVVGYQ